MTTRLCASLAHDLGNDHTYATMDVTNKADVLAPLDDAVHIWPGRYVQASGARIHVPTTPPASPDAEPVLCVHGLGGSAHNWTDLASVLRDRFAVESIDLLGHGSPGRRPATTTP